MAKFKPYKIDQQMLFRRQCAIYVPESHLARLVDKVVEQLDKCNRNQIFRTGTKHLSSKNTHQTVILRLRGW